MDGEHILRPFAPTPEIPAWALEMTDLSHRKSRRPQPGVFPVKLPRPVEDPRCELPLNKDISFLGGGRPGRSAEKAMPHESQMAVAVREFREMKLKEGKLFETEAKKDSTMSATETKKDSAAAEAKRELASREAKKDCAETDICKELAGEKEKASTRTSELAAAKLPEVDDDDDSEEAAFIRRRRILRERHGAEVTDKELDELMEEGHGLDPDHALYHQADAMVGPALCVPLAHVGFTPPGNRDPVMSALMASLHVLTAESVRKKEEDPTSSQGYQPLLYPDELPLCRWTQKPKPEKEQIHHMMKQVMKEHTYVTNARTWSCRLQSLCEEFDQGRKRSPMYAEPSEKAPRVSPTNEKKNSDEVSLAASPTSEKESSVDGVASEARAAHSQQEESVGTSVDPEPCGDSQGETSSKTASGPRDSVSSKGSLNGPAAPSVAIHISTDPPLLAPPPLNASGDQPSSAPLPSTSDHRAAAMPLTRIHFTIDPSSPGGRPPVIEHFDGSSLPTALPHAADLDRKLPAELAGVPSDAYNLLHITCLPPPDKADGDAGPVVIDVRHAGEQKHFTVNPSPPDEADMTTKDGALDKIKDQHRKPLAENPKKCAIDTERAEHPSRSDGTDVEGKKLEERATSVTSTPTSAPVNTATSSSTNPKSRATTTRSTSNTDRPTSKSKDPSSPTKHPSSTAATKTTSDEARGTSVGSPASGDKKNPLVHFVFAFADPTAEEFKGDEHRLLEEISKNVGFQLSDIDPQIERLTAKDLPPIISEAENAPTPSLPSKRLDEQPSAQAKESIAKPVVEPKEQTTSSKARKGTRTSDLPKTDTADSVRSSTERSSATATKKKKKQSMSLPVADQKGPPSSSDATTSTGSKRANLVCCQCQQPVSTKLVCGRCRSAVYCSQSCQKEDWASHKKTCRTRKKRSSTTSP